MEMKNINKIPDMLREYITDQKVSVTFTQWETDEHEEDEAISHFEGYLIECRVAENEFNGMDGAFHFKTDQEEEIIEILMDFPNDDEDIVASVVERTINLFGNESLLRMEKKKG
jgi:hypothetical protein